MNKKVVNRNLYFNYFYKISDKFIFILVFFCLIFIICGIFSSLFLVNMDIQQKDAFRIIYVHVPSAYMSILIYIIMGLMSFFFIIFKKYIFDIIAYSSSKIGIIFTLNALITGSIWGKPIWGTWWIWDARLTSELILLFIYLGYIGLRKAINNKHIASKNCAILNLVGLINIPIIHYSVEWWYTLHQKSTLSGFDKINIEYDMLYPLLFIIIGFFLLYLLLVLISIKNEIIKNKL